MLFHMFPHIMSEVHKRAIISPVHSISTALRHSHLTCVLQQHRTSSFASHPSMADTSSTMSDNTNQDILSDHSIPNICHTVRATELLYASQNGTVHDKLIARETYFLLTFPVMLDLRGRESSRSHNCIPFIISVDEEYDAIRERIAYHFGMVWCELTVVFEGHGINSAATVQDRKLNGENTAAMLRLLRQRGGVDVLWVEGEMREGVGA